MDQDRLSKSLGSKVGGKTPQQTKRPQLFCNEEECRSTENILQPASVSTNKSSHVAWAGSEKALVSSARASSPERSVSQSSCTSLFLVMIKPTPTNRNERQVFTQPANKYLLLFTNLALPKELEKSLNQLLGKKKAQSQPRAMVLRINSMCSKTVDLQDNPVDRYQRIPTKEVNTQEFCFKRLWLAPTDKRHLASG